MKKPSFIIIGAMKCATTTLYEQLKKQDGIFMPELKEPNFYSDDDIFSKGYEWYESLFDNAAPDDIIGEASTHYTKLPTYPNTVNRLVRHNPHATKFIYIMRDPIKRLVSQYIHEWTENKIKVPINEAIYKHPELVEYSLYTKQLEPWITKFGKDAVLPVFFERMMSQNEDELIRVCKFIGYELPPKWYEDSEITNVSSERIRRFPFYSIVIDSSVAEFIRRRFIPKSLRQRVKKSLQITKRPELSAESVKHLKKIFDNDLKQLGESLDIELSYDNYPQQMLGSNMDWK